VPVCTIAKPWNIGWLRYLTDSHYDLRGWLILSYFAKNVYDYCLLIPCGLLLAALGSYNPLQLLSLLKMQLDTRRQLIARLPPPTSRVSADSLDFYQNSHAVLPGLFSQSYQHLRNDIPFLPMFLLLRLSLLSLMDCSTPGSSVSFMDSLLMMQYQATIRSSAHSEEYLQILSTDQKGGRILTEREKFRFWKFASKALRLRMLARIVKALLPKSQGEEAIANAKP
jgi:hypothetical protein